MSEFVWPINPDSRLEKVNKIRRSLFITELALVLRFDDAAHQYYDFKKDKDFTPLWLEEAGKNMKEKDPIYRKLLSRWEEHFDSSPKEEFAGSELHNVVRKVYVQNNWERGVLPVERAYKKLKGKSLRASSAIDLIGKRNKNLEGLKQAYEQREKRIKYKEIET